MTDRTEEDKKKLGICVPWDSPFVFTKFTESVMNLQPPDGYVVNAFWGHGWCPARRHADACEQAIQWGADLLCILGADQVYPQQDMLQRLVDRWKQTGGIIGALVPFRGFVQWNEGMRPFEPLAWRIEADNELDDNGKLVINEHRRPIRREDGDFQRAHLIGTGVTLFSREVLLSLKLPWFYERVDPESFHRVADQDSRFISRLQIEAGVALWVDTTIQVRHANVFLIDNTYSERFADWADPATDSDRAICRFRAELPTTGG